jgi:hypothetical protein
LSKNRHPDVTLDPVTYVLLASLVVLPAIVAVQYWRDRLYRWRLALVASNWLIALATVLPELVDGRLLPESGLWSALSVVFALAGIVGLALTVWFWRQRERPSRGPVSA